MSKTSGLRMTPVEWGMLLILSVLWGGAFFLIEIALRDLPPFTIMILRVGGASLFLWTIVLIRGAAFPRGLGLWSVLTVMAVFNSALPFSLIAWGQVQITSGLSSILIAMTPLFAVITAHFFTEDEAFTRMKGLGVLSGLAGAVILIGPEFLRDIGANFFAQLAVLGGAVSYSIAAVFGRRFGRRDISQISVAAGQVTMAIVLLAPFVLIFDRPWTLDVPSLAGIGAVAGLALGSTGVAYLIYYRVLATAGATNLMLVNFLAPVSALILGIFVLGEVLSIEQLIGMCFIALGLALIDGRLFQGRT
ncbi:MAG: DMT family transporter [Alphaproteobacteria bacterium]